MARKYQINIYYININHKENTTCRTPAVEENSSTAGAQLTSPDTSTSRFLYSWRDANTISSNKHHAALATPSAIIHQRDQSYRNISELQTLQNASRRGNPVVISSTAGALQKPSAIIQYTRAVGRPLVQRYKTPAVEEPQW
jgi:hypothetical protein